MKNLRADIQTVLDYVKYAKTYGAVDATEEQEKAIENLRRAVSGTVPGDKKAANKYWTEADTAQFLAETGGAYR